MDQETAKYIFQYFSNLLTDQEKMAIKHTLSMDKLRDSSNTNLTSIYKAKGWITDDQTVLDLLKDGPEAFEMTAAKRILAEAPDKIFFNFCLKCDQLARTPYARQCRHCGHSWHDMVVAQFKLHQAFQITNSHFFLAGEIVKGQVSQGNYIDLTMLKLNRRPKIVAISQVLKKKDRKATEEIALGIEEVNDEERAYLKKLGAFGTALDVLRGR